MKHLLTVLRNRNVALLLSGRLVSVLGDYLYYVALTVAVYQYSGGKSFYVGLFIAVRLVPGLILGPFTGALADRMGYRQAMIVADLGRMVLVAALALVLSSSTWAVIFPVAMLVTALSSLFRPASVGLIPALVHSKEERLAANAARIEINSIGLIVGSALGGIAAGGGLITQVLLFDAATFAVSALSIVLIRLTGTDSVSRPTTVHRAAETSDRRGILAGLRVLVRRPLLLFAASVMVLPELSTGAIQVWIVPYSVHSLHLGNAGVGYLYSALGVGMAAGGLGAAILGTAVRLDELLAASVLLGGVALILFGTVPVTVAALAFILVMGLAEKIEYTAYETLLQNSVPLTMIGRASGTMESLFFNMVLIGNLVSGLLAATIGLTVSMAGLGALTLLTAGLAWWNLRRTTAHQPDPDLLAKIPAFARVSDEVREWAVRRMVREQFPLGMEVVRQGEEGDSFYAIANGRAEVEVALDGHISTRELGPGDFFGEIALLQNVPRTATVRALETLTCFVLSREDFQELQARATELKESLLETAASRLADDTNFKLILGSRDS